jgi:hypothetical protein
LTGFESQGAAPESPEVNVVRAVPSDAGSGRRDLPGEAHILAIASWYFALGVVPLLGFVWLVLTSAFFVAVDSVMMIVASCALLMALGLSLRSHGSAAIFLLAVHVAQLVWVTNGSCRSRVHGESAASIVVLGALWLWAVAAGTFVLSARGRNLLTPEYRRRMAEDPGIRVRKYGSPYFYVPLAVALLMLAIAGVTRLTR